MSAVDDSIRADGDKSAPADARCVALEREIASSLRDMAGRITRQFWRSITALGDPLSLQLIAAVMRGRAPALLELDDRPDAYDDVGRLCTWDELFPNHAASALEV